MNLLYAFPGGRAQALTFSYDDGTIHDRRLVSIFNHYGMKATFNLNSGIDAEDKIKRSEFRSLYAGHEIACHGLTHHNYPRIPAVQTIEEILEDRKNLEKESEYPIRGLAYPCGRYDESSIELLRSLGIVYSRTVRDTNGFDIPEDFMKWHPTCHHNAANLHALGDSLLEQAYGMNLMYVWGHSYEFNNKNNWNVIEAFCEKMAHLDSVWYASNIEIYDYVLASRRLIFSADGRMVQNPSAIPVWIKNNWEPLEIPPGAIVHLKN